MFLEAGEGGEGEVAAGSLQVTSFHFARAMEELLVGQSKVAVLTASARCVAWEVLYWMSSHSYH
jgi:hypothetical protein